MPAGGEALGAGRGGGGALEQPANPIIVSAAIMPAQANAKRVADLLRKKFMLVLMLEAFAVLLLFVFIIWWTMFSGRKNGELQGQHQDENSKTP